MTAPELDRAIDFRPLIKVVESHLEAQGATGMTKAMTGLLYGLVLAEGEHAIRYAASIKFQKFSRIADLRNYPQGRDGTERLWSLRTRQSPDSMLASDRYASTHLSCPAQQLSDTTVAGDNG